MKEKGEREYERVIDKLLLTSVLIKINKVASWVWSLSCRCWIESQRFKKKNIFLIKTADEIIFMPMILCINKLFI